MTAEPDSCRRCGQLEDQVAELEQRTRFRPCGHAGPGTAMVEVSMPDGSPARGFLCRPHQVLLAGRAFAPRLLMGYGGQAGPCGWLVPAEEAMEDDGGARDDARDLEEAGAWD